MRFDEWMRGETWSSQSLSTLFSFLHFQQAGKKVRVRGEEFSLSFQNGIVREMAELIKHSPLMLVFFSPLAASSLESSEWKSMHEAVWATNHKSNIWDFNALFWLTEPWQGRRKKKSSSRSMIKKARMMTKRGREKRVNIERVLFKNQQKA